MVSWNSNFSKERQGLAKCPVCGAWYNPTFGKNHCPPKRFYRLIFAAIIITLFFVMPVDAGAQVAPEPTAWPTDYCYVDENGNPVCFSGINDQTPTPGPFVPTKTATPTATPELGPPPVAPTATPTIVIRPLPKHYVYLSLIYR